MWLAGFVKKHSSYEPESMERQLCASYRPYEDAKSPPSLVGVINTGMGNVCEGKLRGEALDPVGEGFPGGGDV